MDNKDTENFVNGLVEANHTYQPSTIQDSGPVRPEGMDFFEWLSSDKESLRATNKAMKEAGLELDY
jgi:hypothetical protein